MLDGPIKKMHEECASMVRNGIAFYYDDKGKIKDRFPKEERNSNGVCHVRPHARVGLDHYKLPVADKEMEILFRKWKRRFWRSKAF